MSKLCRCRLYCSNNLHIGMPSFTQGTPSICSRKKLKDEVQACEFLTSARAASAMHLSDCTCCYAASWLWSKLGPCCIANLASFVIVSTATTRSARDFAVQFKVCCARNGEHAASLCVTDNKARPATRRTGKWVYETQIHRQIRLKAAVLQYYLVLLISTEHVTQCSGQSKH